VPPFPTILLLQDIRVRVDSTNHGDKASYIEASIDYFLGIGPILSVSNINPDYRYIRFGQDFDDSRFGCKNNVVKYVIAL